MYAKVPKNRIYLLYLLGDDAPYMIPDMTIAQYMDCRDSGIGM